MSSEHLFWGQGNENYSNAIIKMRPAWQKWGGGGGEGRSGGGGKDFLLVLSFLISGEFSWGPRLRPLNTERLGTLPGWFAEEDLAWGQRQCL